MMTRREPLRDSHGLAILQSILGGPQRGCLLRVQSHGKGFYQEEVALP